MAFLTRTRIVQVATGTEAAKTILQTPVVFRTSAVGQVVQTMAEAMALVPAGSRPPQADWWQYVLQWEVQSSCVPHIRGVVPNTGRLVFDCDMWDTAAARTAAPTAPQRRNTFVHEFTSRRLAGAQAEIRAAIEDYLLRATFGSYPADGRDTRIVTTTDPAQDPLGLLTRQAITDADGVPADLPARWRSAEG